MSDLDRLFYWRGIAEEYLNYRGEKVKVPLENRLTLLETMGIPAADPKAVATAAYELDVEPWRHFFPPLQTCVLREGPGSFYVNLHPARVKKELAWELYNDAGAVVDSGALVPASVAEIGDYAFNGLRYSRRLIPVNVTEPGYYRIRITISEDLDSKVSRLKDEVALEAHEAVLALAPPTVFQPGWLETGERPWGFIIQLYTLRSTLDWGIGNFSDLKQLVAKSAELGVDIIGLNPLHALLPDVEHNKSPYSPSDRRFINALYIDPQVEPDYLESPSLQSPEIQGSLKARIESLRAHEMVNYTAVKDLLYGVFEQMFDRFESLPLENSRQRSFDSFMEEAGIGLQQFALYEVANNRWANARFGASVAPEILAADPSTAIFASALTQYRQEVRFHCYLQWLAHVQLEQCQEQAVALGMKVGLVRDLAVGADGGGAEASSNPLQFCRGASVGAPPDPLAEQGQNWGLPPMDPAHLRATGFAHFIQILRENMSRCGALRIDHAMSLMRLWWCPPGTTADHGAYVYYPFEEMLALLCLESHLNLCAIIGEDLGVVPAEFREAITTAGIFTNRVFYFEKENYSWFKAPENYDVHALAMVNNHDVPTLKSWWDGTDLVLRDRLNIFEEGVDYATMVSQREHDKQQVFAFLDSQQLLPVEWRHRNIHQAADFPLIAAILQAVSRVVSRLYVIQLEDVLLMDAPVNVPGTYLEHPNWQRKLSRTIEDIFASELTRDLLKKIQNERSR